jgi:hypothetical protein
MTNAKHSRMARSIRWDYSDMEKLPKWARNLINDAPYPVVISPATLKTWRGTRQQFIDAFNSQMLARVQTTALEFYGPDHPQALGANDDDFRI